MNQNILKGANVVSMFCRLNINARKDLPLRASEIGLLIYTVKSELPVTPVMAAEFFEVSKPMIASMVKVLIGKGFIIKIPSENDKRSYILNPTSKAEQLVESVYDEYFKGMQLLVKQMGVEQFTDMISLLETANSILLEDKKNG